MIQIRFSKSLHYLTRDSVSPKALDISSLRDFLITSLEFFLQIKELIAAEEHRCTDVSARQRLVVNLRLAGWCHKRVKNCLPHLKTTEELFALAQETESLLHYLTESAWQQAEHLPKVFGKCLEQDVMDLEDRIVEECETVLESQKTLIAS